jgi:hypothetical protein
MLLLSVCGWGAGGVERARRWGRRAAAELAKEGEGERREEWDRMSMQAAQVWGRAGGGGSEVDGSCVARSRRRRPTED